MRMLKFHIITITNAKNLMLRASVMQKMQRHGTRRTSLTFFLGLGLNYESIALWSQLTSHEQKCACAEYNSCGSQYWFHSLEVGCDPGFQLGFQRNISDYWHVYLHNRPIVNTGPPGLHSYITNNLQIYGNKPAVCTRYGTHCQASLHLSLWHIVSCKNLRL